MTDLFGDLRSALHRAPTPDRWEKLADHLLQWPRARLIEQALPYVWDHFGRTEWGALKRPMPQTWGAALHQHTLPMDLVQLVGEFTCTWAPSLPQAKRWAAQDWRSLERLGVHAHWSHQVMEALAQASWPALGSLAFAGKHMDEAKLNALSTWKLPALHTLDLAGSALDARTLYALSASGWWAQLERLKIGSRSMSARVLTQLAEEVHMPRLTHMHVHNWAMDWPSAFSMSHAAWAQTVESLKLSACALGSDELRALFSSAPPSADPEDRARDRPHLPRKWPSLRHLDVRSNRLGHAAIMHLSDMLCLEELETLNLSRNAFDAEDLFEDAHVLQRAQSLRALDLSGNPLGSSVASMERMQPWGALRHLHMSSISLREVSPLGQSFLRRLRTLDLGSNPFEDNPLRALLADTSPAQWEHLEALHLPNTQMARQEVRELLRTLEAPPKLRLVDLRFNDLSQDLLQQAHPSWSRCVLKI